MKVVHWSYQCWIRFYIIISWRSLCRIGLWFLSSISSFLKYWEGGNISCKHEIRLLGELQRAHAKTDRILSSIFSFQIFLKSQHLKKLNTFTMVDPKGPFLIQYISLLLKNLMNTEIKLIIQMKMLTYKIL